MKTAMAPIMTIIMIRSLSGLTRLAKRAPISVPIHETHDQADDRQPGQFQCPAAHRAALAGSVTGSAVDGKADGLRAMLRDLSEPSHQCGDRQSAANAEKAG